jgi:hypothetical protein
MFCLTNSGTAEMWVRDGIGNMTQLSTHEGTKAIHNSFNQYTGRGRVVDLDALGEVINVLSLAKSWSDAQAGIRAAGGTNIYQVTTRPPVDWDAEQAAFEFKADAKIAAWQSDTNAPEVKGEKPAKHAKAPKPKWLTDALGGGK